MYLIDCGVDGYSVVCACCMILGGKVIGYLMMVQCWLMEVVLRSYRRFSTAVRSSTIVASS